MTIIQALILSIVEGITEFLPVSSTGHLILVSQLLGILQTEFIKTFEICIQAGAVTAIFFLYIKTLFEKRYLIKNLFFAFIPSAILGLVLYKIIKNFLLGSSYITVIALVVGGFLFFFIEKLIDRKNKVITLKEMTAKQAITIGITQSLAVIPGVSRSAATIFSGMFLGLTKQDAVEFSFLLALPTIVAATTLDLIKTSFSFSQQEIVLLIVGCIGSFISALIAVRFLVTYLKDHSFIPFGVYRIIIGILFWSFMLR